MEARVKVQVLYNNRDITNDISNSLISVKYTDKTEGESDSIELDLEDVGNKWKGPWYPNTGALLSVKIMNAGKVLNCGVFEIDQIDISGPPSHVSIKGIAAAASSLTRTKNNVAHSNCTLLNIAQSIANKNGLNIVGSIEDIYISKATQRNETDIQFLNRIGKEYGYVFSIRGKDLIFVKKTVLESRPAVYTINIADIISYSFSDKGMKGVAAAEVAYSNPETKEVVKSRINIRDYRPVRLDTEQQSPYQVVANPNIAKVYVRAESKQQAEEKAKAVLYDTNSQQQTGRLTVMGNPYLIAGNNIKITGLGNLSGVYSIVSSDHDVSPGIGWRVTIEVKRVGFVSQAEESKINAVGETTVQNSKVDGRKINIVDYKPPRLNTENPFGFTVQ